jgi:hypothetical protein
MISLQNIPFIPVPVMNMLGNKNKRDDKNKKNIHETFNDSSGTDISGDAVTSVSDVSGSDASGSNLFSSGYPSSSAQQTPPSPTVYQNIMSNINSIVIASQDSTKSIFSKIGNIFWYSFIIFFIYIMPSFFFASILSNGAIMYPFPIRVILFIVTLSICLFSNIAIFQFAIVAFIAMYFYGEYKKMEASALDKDVSRHSQLPHIFALLPISTDFTWGGLMSTILYPFTFPKPNDTEKGFMDTIEKEYTETLKSNFKNFDEYIKEDSSTSKEISEGYTTKIKKLYDDFQKIMTARYKPIVPPPSPSPPGPIEDKNQNINSLLKEKENSKENTQPVSMPSRM